MRVSPLRILFIDAYDSFSNNIISLLETALSCHVRTVKIDDPILLASDAALQRELKHYVAVVCGPGPGHPENDHDVGIFKKIWRLADEDLLPVLGICLGFQSLCLEFGALVGRLKGPQHGIIRRVTHVGEGEHGGEGTIFHGVGELKATHYQSLCVDIGQDTISPQTWQDSKWLRAGRDGVLMPLAYAENDLSRPNDSGIRDARVLVAVNHSSKPFWALQYHPESICTETESHKVIQNWFHQAQSWNLAHKRIMSPSDPKFGIEAVRPSLLSRCDLGFSHEFSASGEEDLCFWKMMELPVDISVADLAEELCTGQDRVILESTNSNEQVSPGTADVRGRFSIITLDVDGRLEYNVGANHVQIRNLNGSEKFPLKSDGVWPFVARYLEERRVTQGPSMSPFWGGFTGFTTYELGLETIDVSSTKMQRDARPDLCFAWISKSLVVDHRLNRIYLQHLGPRRLEQTIQSRLEELRCRINGFFQSRLPPSPSGSFGSAMEGIGSDTPLSTPPLSTSSSAVDLHRKQATISPKSLCSVQKPDNGTYEDQVRTCQSYISAGDSYELCLTDQTSVMIPQTPSMSSWSLYRALRSRQPAPFASYISLGSATLVSSSPERFLTWNEDNHCSLRPMKGTVKKSAEVDSLDKARLLLDVPKEKAENLMIVDLVRHDLHGICGSGNVQVPRLCVVEEYKSVFQMITVVEGQIQPPPQHSQHVRHTGLDVLAASLPPGSMTGAPKKRSCQILQGIEKQERSLYSGVVGYLDVRGRGDWSVTIRSAFKWDDDNEAVDIRGEQVLMEKWRIGAGGAVTTLSTAVGEREEMITKLGGTLGIFL